MCEKQQTKECNAHDDTKTEDGIYDSCIKLSEIHVQKHWGDDKSDHWKLREQQVMIYAFYRQESKFESEDIQFWNSDDWACWSADLIIAHF